MAKMEMKVELDTELLEQLLNEFTEAMNRKDKIIQDLDERVRKLEGGLPIFEQFNVDSVAEVK